MNEPPQEVRKAKKLYHGWWIVVGAFLIQMLISSLVQRTFSLYFVLLQGEFGWSRALLSIPFSFAQAEATATSLTGSLPVRLTLYPSR